MTRWSVASIFVCGALLLTTVNGQQPQKEKDKDQDSYVDGELLVQFSPTLNIQQRNAELKNHNLARCAVSRRSTSTSSAYRAASRLRQRRAA
jgi:hypothetical protein